MQNMGLCIWGMWGKRCGIQDLSCTIWDIQFWTRDTRMSRPFGAVRGHQHSVAGLGSTMVQVGLSPPAPRPVLCKQLTLKYD